MSDSRDSKTLREALEKVEGGARLLIAGDYEGAIAACTEAIQLDPGSEDAYLIRSEAYRLTDRPSSLRFIFSPLSIIGEFFAFVPRALRWGWHEGFPDAMDRAHGLEPKEPRPRFREHIDEQRQRREMIWARARDLLAESHTSKPATHQQAEELAQMFREGLGIDARALEPAQGLEEGDEEVVGWVEVSEGPIRWVVDSSSCLIPDGRIKRLYPRVSIGVSGDQWNVIEYPHFESGWGPILLDNEISLYVAGKLSQDTRTGLDFEIETDLVRGCWILSTGFKVTTIWNGCQRVAKALLAMPMSSGK